MTEYITTREQCQSEIVGVVCSGCGGQLEPIETVDNARRPTFWVGCQRCSRFDSGAIHHPFHENKRKFSKGEHSQ